MFDAFAEAGGNFIDTAHVYTEGASERLVGEFIKPDRDHFVVATKYTPHTGTDLSKSGNSRKNMMRCVEESLRRLGTDHIDLYLLHFWDGTTPIDEIMRGLDDLVSAGKILYLAVSDVPAWRIAQANTIAELRGWSAFIGMQVEYSLTERTAERELIPMAEELDLGVTAWSPLAQGVLSGKFNSGTPNAATRQQRDQIPPRSLEIAQLVTDIAQKIGRSPCSGGTRSADAAASRGRRDPHHCRPHAGAIERQPRLHRAGAGPCGPAGPGCRKPPSIPASRTT